MTAVLILLAAATVAGLLLLEQGLRAAPEGYEDIAGFHFRLAGDSARGAVMARDIGHFALWTM